MTPAEIEQGRRGGILAAGERFLGSEWVGVIAFALLLGSFNLTAWQGLLAIIVFVQRTTKRPVWLLREQAQKRALSGGEA